MENKLDIAKKIIEEQYEYYPYGIFNCRNIVGDHMRTIYDGNGLGIDVCDDYEYFEVFGLTQKEFDELSDFYDKLKNDEPYRIPAEKILEHTAIEPHYYKMIDYEFKFAWCERIPLDQREIEIHERERKAYEKGGKLMEKERYCCPICGRFPESYYHAPRLLIKEMRTEDDIVTVEKISLYCRECNYTWEEENDI